MPLNTTNKTVLHKRLLTIALYQIKLGELVWKGYCVLHSHHQPLHWWDQGQSEKLQLSSFYWDQDPAVWPLFWLSKHSEAKNPYFGSLGGGIATEGVSPLHHLSSTPCSQPLPAERTTTSFWSAADCQGRYTAHSLGWRQIMVKVPSSHPFLQLTQIQEGGQQVKPHRYPKGQNHFQ